MYHTIVKNKNTVFIKATFSPDLRQELDVKDRQPLSNSTTTTPTNPQSLESRLQGLTINNIKSQPVVKNGVSDGTSARSKEQQNNTPNKGMTRSCVFCLFDAFICMRMIDIYLLHAFQGLCFKSLTYMVMFHICYYKRLLTSS